MKLYCQSTLRLIDLKLEELAKEQQALVTRKRELIAQKTSINNLVAEDHLLTPTEKVDIFFKLFRGREDIFAVRWENKQGRSGYSVACHNNGSKVSVINQK
jgi:hypothetical protein